MKQEEKEQQLREAANEYAEHNYHQVHTNFKVAIFLKGAQSEAAKAYHQQTESVNLDELRNEFYSLVDTGKMEYYKIFNFFLPYLNPKEQKQSEAVESKLWDELFKIAWSPDNYTSDSEKIIKEKFHITIKTKII